VRRVPVRRNSKKEQGEGKEKQEEKDKRAEEPAALKGEEEEKVKSEEKEEEPKREMQMRVIRVETRAEEEQNEPEQKEKVLNLLPHRSKTTTVLLPKQRQISLGSSGKREKKPMVEVEKEELEQAKGGGNGWQFMDQHFGGAETIQNVGNGGAERSEGGRRGRGGSAFLL
jgi:hypothetical protein